MDLVVRTMKRGPQLCRLSLTLLPTGEMGKGNVGTLHAERGLANHVPLFQTVDRRILEVQAV